MTQEFNIETPRFQSPEEEIDFLKKKVEEKERLLSQEKRETGVENIAENVITEYKSRNEEDILEPKYRMKEDEKEGVVLDLSPERHDKVIEELLGLISTKGLKNALSVVEKMKNPHISDDFHRFLVQYITHVSQVPGLKEGSDVFKALHFKLFEIVLPWRKEEGPEKTFKDMVSSMEQFYAGMLSLSDGKDNTIGKNYFTLEIALSHANNEIVFYAAVPRAGSDIFEKQILGVFPDAQIHEQKNDYNIFNDDGVSAGARAVSLNNPVFPIKTYDEFNYAPLNILLNTFSKLKEKGEGAAVQMVISPAGDTFLKRYGQTLDKLEEGASLEDALPTGSFVHGLKDVAGEIILGRGLTKKDIEKGESERMVQKDEFAVNQVSEKISSTIVATNIRIIASAETKERADNIVSDISSAFNQFTDTRGNGIVFEKLDKKPLLKLFNEFSYRTFSHNDIVPLNLKELTTVFHFPVSSVESGQLVSSQARSAPAPLNMPKDGIRLGVNKHRGQETDVYIDREDLMRHFYVLGQTGTGKTTLLKNMIVQDIQAGEGVCMIDPHGNDIIDILENIPEDRFEDVIYFDPAHVDRPMGLNLLEYNPRFPEQKTFVVNELFNIFQKLYGATPEAMGPVFEQYFRNAAMLVIEHPESGNTLFDVSRVLSNPAYRELKLSHCKNPVVAQFWKDIASKTTGESSLANIAPYVTSKFDIFLSNDIMRPIVMQQSSAFNFRNIMDEKKIFLANLSKGRLGDINAHLLGLILVGKILMAALSRVSESGEQKSFPDFRLYIDEFQNITTDSISTILSEARKYRLGLNIAHQFIGQLDEKIKNAVFGNVGSMAIFRAGADDAEFLEKQLEPVFNASEIMNLENYNAYMRLLINGHPAKPFNVKVDPPPEGSEKVAQHLKEVSYKKYGRDRSEVEEKISSRYHIK